MKKVKPLLLVAAMATIITACSPPPKAATENLILKDTIQLATAQRLVANYNSRANHVTKGGLRFKDSRCVWFSLAQLQSLTQRIAKENGDGVRFYLAAYDKTMKPDIKKINPQYLDYTTLVMVSTRLDSVSKYHFDYYTNTKAQGSMFMLIPENQGELCPPPETCLSIGAFLLADTTGLSK
jgi:hypothetical protein